MLKKALISLLESVFICKPETIGHQYTGGCLKTRFSGSFLLYFSLVFTPVFPIFLYICPFVRHDKNDG